MVTPATIITQAKVEGVNLVLSQGKIRAAGNDTALLKWKPIILENKTAIIALLTGETKPPTQNIGNWENFINWWLDHIGERDPELRNVCLNQCRRDDEARRYFLSHAILEFREACPGQT